MPGSGGSAGYDDNGNETIRIWEKTSPTPEYPGSVKLSGSWKREVPTVYEWRHYNGFHQLIRVNQDDKEIICQYRGDGLRHSSEVQELAKSQSKTKIHYWDGADIVAEQTDGGSVKRYLRGINLLAGEADGMVYYYIHNEHGDVAQLWGQSGTCKASYEYDAFGNERKPEKGDENPFRYCGEYLDLETDTYYLRARSYRAGTGRFTSEDSIDGVARKMPNGQEITDPLSLNKYTYCHNNPTRYSDPSGHFIISTTAIAAIAFGAIGAIGGAVIGKLIAEKMEVAKEDQWKYIVGGAAGGAVFGAMVGYLAGPAIVAATGVSGISVTSGGISMVEAGTAGATGFEQARQLLQAQQMGVGEGAGNPAELASRWQGSIDYPGVDNWINVTLEKGTKVWGGAPGQSNFYTTDAVMKLVETDATKLYQGIQVGKGIYPTYRAGMTMYEVMENITVGYAETLANPQYGAGGFPQYFITNYQSVLQPILTRIMTNR